MNPNLRFVYTSVQMELYKSSCVTLETNIWLFSKVDLTAYVERHEFCFDAVLDQQVTNDEVIFFFSLKKSQSTRFHPNMLQLAFATKCLIYFYFLNFFETGISWNCTADHSYHISANKSNLFCLWPDRYMLVLLC